MKRLLGLIAALAATTAVALNAGPALATTVHCGDVITQDTTLDADLLCQPAGLAVQLSGHNVILDMAGHHVEGIVAAYEANDSVIENGRISGGVSVGHSDVTVQNNFIAGTPHGRAIGVGFGSAV